MKSYFVDEKDRKGAAVWEYIATPKKLQLLETLLDTDFAKLKNVEELRNALNVLRSTPLVPSSSVNPSKQMSSDTKYTPQDVHVLVSALNFNAALQSSQLRCTPQLVEASLETGADVIAAMKQWNRVWERNVNGDAPVFSLYGIPRHQMLRKGLKNQTIHIEEFVPRNDFASTESFALFSCIETPHGMQEGYLNTPGNLVPLSQAKLYDSLLSAQTAMDRSYSVKQYQQVQIVRLNLAVSGLESIITSSNSRLVGKLEDSCIQTVAADVQKQAIENALRNATDEQLRTQWEERSTTTAKRKM